MTETTTPMIKITTVTETTTPPTSIRSRLPNSNKIQKMTCIICNKRFTVDILEHKCLYRTDEEDLILNR